MKALLKIEKREGEHIEENQIYIRQFKKLSDASWQKIVAEYFSK